MLILSSDPGNASCEPYIVMELLEGPNLARVLATGADLPLPRIIEIICQVLSALGEAHAQGVIHRDLKPANIILLERGRPDFVKVCDFGVAKLITLDSAVPAADSTWTTAHGMLCGTPEYMSPEQARAEPLDGRTDPPGSPDAGWPP